MAKNTKPEERQEHLVQLSLDQLNHEKAKLKVKMAAVGTRLSDARKEAGDLNAAYEELDREMLRRDTTYRQLELAETDAEE
jgi:hypothetical protein